MELTVDQMLQQGVAAHNAGNLQEAERLYRTILQSVPTHPDANHNLGLIAISENQSAVALPLFKIALEVNPEIEDFWLSYIHALIEGNQIKEAKRALKKAKKAGFSGEKVDNLKTQLKKAFRDFVQLYSENKEQLSRLDLASGLEDVPHRFITTNAVYAPWENDEGFSQLLYKIKGKTLVDNYCLYELWSLAGQLTKIPGDVIEVGTWKGGSGCLIASRFAKESIDVTSYLCDTFVGVVKAGEKDSFYKNGEHADSCVEEVEALAETLKVRLNKNSERGFSR